MEIHFGPAREEQERDFRGIRNGGAMRGRIARDLIQSLNALVLQRVALVSRADFSCAAAITGFAVSSCRSRLVAGMRCAR